MIHHKKAQAIFTQPIHMFVRPSVRPWILLAYDCMIVRQLQLQIYVSNWVKVSSN